MCLPFYLLHPSACCGRYNQLLINRVTMAFVFGKSQKKSVFQANKAIPGPGQYKEAVRQINEHSAPFNSSSFKVTEFDVLTTNTGPGSYNPKHAKQVNTQKRLKMTSSFNSKVERFKTEYHPSNQQKGINIKVGLSEEGQPRKYKSQSLKPTYNQAITKTKSKMEAIQDANNQRKTNSIGGNKQFVRIILSNPHNTEMNQSVIIESSIVRKQNGPGSYNIQNAAQALHHKSMHVVDWSRNTIKRFKTEKNKNPGPGEYEPAQPKKSITSNSAPFAFQGLRSHMDQVIYKTKMPFKVKVIEEKHLKDRYPGPGQYDPKLTTSKSFHYGEEAFGTVIPEESYGNAKQQQYLPGPGYYQINASNNSNIKEEIKKTREKIFGKSKAKPQKVSTLEQNHKEQIRKQCIRQIQNEGNKYYSLEERCTSKIGNFSQSQRFKMGEKRDKAVAPGPGQYKINNRSEQKFARGIQYGFNSTADRLHDLNEQEKTPFYDVDRNDMGKRALRIKKNIQNLKQIDIEKAPFNCKQRRFSQPSNSEKNEEDLVDMNWNLPKAQHKHQTPQKDRSQYDILGHRYKIDRHQNSVFKSKSKRAWMNQSNMVGPGDYNYTTTFQKKSFNQQYLYKPPIKIRSTYRTRSSLA